MSAESTSYQEQLCIKDNETMQQEQGPNLTKPCKVNSPNSTSSVSVTMQIGSISEQISCKNEVDNPLINENKSSTISQTSMGKDTSDSSRPDPVIELSDDHLTHMMKLMNDRIIALNEGLTFDADKKNSLPLEECSISDESKKADNNKNLDVLQLTIENKDNADEKLHQKENSIAIDSHVEIYNENGSTDENKTENNNNTEEKLYLKEESMSIDSHCETNNKKEPIDGNKTCKLNLLPSKKLLIVDESNNANDIAEIEKKSSIEKSRDSIKLDNNGNQFNGGHISVDKLENIDLKKALSHSELKDISLGEHKINSIHHMGWLKVRAQEAMDANKKRMARKSSIEKDDYIEDIKEEFADDTKINSKKKRSNQRKNLKTKSADSPKQDDKEDTCKKSSEDFESIDTSKSGYGRGVEKSKDTKTTQLPTSQRISIGRGRGDRRKISLGNSQARGQIDINDQRDTSHKSSSEEKSSTMLEKSLNKIECNSKKESSSKKVEKADLTENTVGSTELTKQKEQKIYVTKGHSKSPQNAELSHNQSSVKSTSESLIQESKGKIDMKKDQLLPADNQQSQNKSTTNLSSSRPIYGRLPDKTNCEKTICSVRGFGQNTDEAIKNNKSSQSISGCKDNVYKFSEETNGNQHENKTNQSYSSLLKGKEESCSNRYTNSSNTYDQDFPRWNHNYHPDMQMVKKDETKGHTSNKHRNFAEEKRKSEELFAKNQDSRYFAGRYSDRSQDNNVRDQYADKSQDKKHYEESFGKNQAFGDKTEGNRWNSDRYQDSRYSTGRYSDRYQDNNARDQYSDKSQDYKNYEQSFGKNQASDDRTEVARWNSDRYQDSRYSAGRYSDRYQDNNVHDKYSDKNRDDKSYVERYSNKSEDCKSFRNTDTDKSQAGRRDTYFDNNRRNRGFGDKSSDCNQDRYYSSNYYNKFRDSKSSSDRYSDNLQTKTLDERSYNKKYDEQTKTSDERSYNKKYDEQTKTSDERSYNKKFDENEKVTKKEEPSNKSFVSFDKNKNYSDNSHTAVKSSDSSNRNQSLPSKNNYNPNSTKVTHNTSHPTNEDVNENYSEKNHQPFNLDDKYRNQDILNNFEIDYNKRTLCPQHAQLEQFQNNFWLPPDQTDLTKLQQYKSDVKSQKHLDNTEQAKVQMGLNQVQQSQSRSPVAFSSAVDQNFDLNGRNIPLTDVTISQPSQSNAWSSYKNISNQDAVYSLELQNESPYSNANIVCNPAVINEYNLQYSQGNSDTTTQYNTALAPGQKPSVAMAFEGNQNVQRALGMNPRILNQVNDNDSSRSSITSPAPSQPMYSNETVAQFFQAAAPESQTTLTCMHSTMNVNAQPFEVPKQSNQEQYAVQPMVSLNNNLGLDVVHANATPKDYEEYLNIRKEICELSQQLAFKQGQLLNIEARLFKNASTSDKSGLNITNQQSNPPIQHMNNNQMQESNQILTSSYGQVKSSNYPPGFANVSMDTQNAQLNLYRMLTNVQNFTSDSLPSSNVSESNSAQAIYLAQRQMFQQQTATLQTYSEKTANSPTYINIMPQSAEQRQIRGVNQFSK